MKLPILLSTVLYLASGAPVSESPSLCAGGATPHIVIATDQGKIVARLLEAAAPGAVRRLARLVDGPVFHSEIFEGQEVVPTVGYYDGLSFVHTQPHIEIGTDTRRPGDLLEIEKG